MVPTRMLIGIVLAAFGTWIAIANLRVAWRLWILRQHAPSWTPLLGGGCIAAGLAAQQNAVLASYWWVPLIVEYGCLPGMLHTAIAWVWYGDRKDEG